MGNIASTASYTTIPRMNVSKEFVRRNRAEIDKEELTGLECT
jgi:poly-gamma-glutamate capsule biosynthesis protein CapA/YwtB (metallophosphatase superfamily)